MLMLTNDISYYPSYVAIITCCLNVLATLAGFAQESDVVEFAVCYTAERKVFQNLEHSAYIKEGDVGVTRDYENGRFVGNYVLVLSKDSKYEYADSTMHAIAKRADGMDGCTIDKHITWEESEQLRWLLLREQVKRNCTYEEMGD